MRALALLALLALLVLLLAPLAARAQRPSSDHDAAPVIRAARRVGAVRIDGRLDEAAWAAATPAGGFRQIDPHEGEPASERTEVRVLVDDAALYVGARMYDREPGRVTAQLARRDDAVDTDIFELYLDSYHDHLTAWVFRVTPAGARRDAALAADGSQDNSWDAVWESAARVDSLGWTAELRIPLSQLRYTPSDDASDDATWGIQFDRRISRRSEVDLFAFTPKSQQAGVFRYGHLAGLGRLPAPARLELRPYARARAEYADPGAGNPFRSGHDLFPAAGADLKYGLSPSLTLDATVNPDFGQVELDPAVVNLTANEVFFEERRPFFVEGQEIFRFGRTRSYNGTDRFNVFNSRRIGRAPQRSLGSLGYAYVDVPNEAAIAAAAKVTGKTRRGWSVGLLEAVTLREEARVATIDTLTGALARARTPVEPLTNYAVARLRRDLRGGNTVIGAAVTAVRRDMGDPRGGEAGRGDSLLARQLRRGAYVGGLDWNHAWGNRTWALDGFVVGSTVRGDARAVAATQRSPVRYLQRPDARAFRLDTTRTRLDGYAMELTAGKIAGRHWRGSLTYQDVSPGFEVNDLGAQGRADKRSLSPFVIYADNTPGRLFQSWSVAPYANVSWNYDGDRTQQDYGLILNGTLHSFWNLNARGSWHPATVSDRLTRGGPLGQSPEGGNVSVDVASNRARPYAFDAAYTYSWNTAGGWGTYAGATFILRPAGNVTLRLSPELSRTHAKAQYVGAFPDPTATATGGVRYVFSDLRQTQPDVTVRVDWTFTPALSLQLFAQPLVSAVDFRGYKGLAAPRRFAFDRYGPDRLRYDDTTATYALDFDGDPATPAATFGNPDFNRRSLIGDAVLRWEYRPGSTLFLVWQQLRDESASLGDFALRRDVEALLAQRARNVVAVKATFWVAR